jgi:hypothetical protein
VSGSRLAWTAEDDDDAERRKIRKDRKITTILHTGYDAATAAPT